VNKERWMREWMTHPKSGISPSPLRLGRFREPIYFLLNSITWKPNSEQASQFEPVEVPVGFVTDLASIPQIFFALLRPDGDYAYASIVHDYLYWAQTRTRATSDQIFKMSMRDFSVARWKLHTIYQAVKWFGCRAWNENARLKQAGERRFLKQFPPDALTLWTVWKRRPDVFSD
jgi:hypothetical protein